MPLGASITEGQRSSHHNGYRKDLRDLLVSEGYSVDMVGSRQNGDMEDNDHEGWSGYRISQVLDKAKKSVPSMMPNLFTINAGTNDCVQNTDIDNAGKRMDTMLEYLWITSPNSTIILSTLLINLNENIEGRVQRVNKQIRDLATRKIAESKRIIFAEMHGDDGPQSGEIVDGTHPNDSGYNKMAKIWHRSIQEAAEKGFLVEPTA